MSTGLKEQKCQLHVVLLPRHQPVGLNVAFPLPFPVSRQSVWMIQRRKCSCGCQYINSIVDEPNIKSTLLAAFQVLFEALSVANLVHSLIFA